MRNRWLLNIGLAALIGALVLLVVYKPGTHMESAGAALTTISPDAIQRIRLLRPKKPEIVLEKSGESWRLTAPRAARANKVNDEQGNHRQSSHAGNAGHHVSRRSWQ